MPLKKPVTKKRFLLPIKERFIQMSNDEKKKLLNSLSINNLTNYIHYLLFNDQTDREDFLIEQIEEGPNELKTNEFNCFSVEADAIIFNWYTKVNNGLDVFKNIDSNIHRNEMNPFSKPDIKMLKHHPENNNKTPIDSMKNLFQLPNNDTKTNDIHSSSAVHEPYKVFSMENIWNDIRKIDNSIRSNENTMDNNNYLQSKSISLNDFVLPSLNQSPIGAKSLGFGPTTTTPIDNSKTPKDYNSHYFERRKNKTMFHFYTDYNLPEPLDFQCLSTDNKRKLISDLPEMVKRDYQLLCYSTLISGDSY